MDLKKIFKPTIIKILITLLCFLLLLFIRILGTVPYDCIGCFGIGMSSGYNHLHNMKNYSHPIITWIILLIELVISYVIACVIIHFFSKHSKE
jgi:hypothetical protein